MSSDMNIIKNAAVTEQSDHFANDPITAGGAPSTSETVAPKPTSEHFKNDPVSPAGPASVAATAGGLGEKKVSDDEVAITATPVESGILGYKAPGLVNSLRFKKHFFYVQDEPVPVSDLQHYLRVEKRDVANATAAHASETGKGLLFYSSREEDKKTPSGVLNLTEASDLVKVGENEFSFKLQSHKHTFQASSATARNGWIVTIEKSIEHKTNKDAVTNSEKYKETHSALAKGGLLAAAPVAGAAVASGKRDKSAEPVVGKETKSHSKARSQSRRRSLFGLPVGKKEEAEPKLADSKVEEPKADDSHHAQSVAARVLAAPVVDNNTEQVPVVGQMPSIMPVVVGAGAGAGTGAGAIADGPALVEPAHKTAEEPVLTNGTENSKTSVPKKRQSVFGSLFSKVTSPTSEKKESEAALAPEASAVTTEAKPNDIKQADEVLPAPVAATEPVHTANEHALTSEAKDSKLEKAPETLPAPSAVTEPAKHEEKRKSGFFGLGSMKEKKASGSDSEKEDKKSTGIAGMFRRPSKAVKSGNKDKTTNGGAVAAATTSPVVPEKDESKITDAGLPTLDKQVESGLMTAEPLKEGESAPVVSTDAATPVVANGVTTHAASNEVSATA